jgi:cytochrome c oxidase assembly protein subunit 15
MVGNVTHKPFTTSPWPHRWAVLLSLLTFPLIWLGGLVTTYDAGMAVPDWPGTYGYNLFLYPWSTWFFGPWDLFIEHGHRLLAAVVGLVVILMLVSSYGAHVPRHVRGCAWVALLLVLLQGGLGGLRVLFDARTIAMVHGCLGPSFFAFAVVLAVSSSRFWRSQSMIISRNAAGLRRLALATALLAGLQLLLGAQLRHVAEMTAPRYFSLFVVFHVFVAVVLVGHGLVLAARMYSLGRSGYAFQVITHLLVVLLLAQIALGASTWVVKYGWPVWFADWRFAASYTVQAASWWQSVVVTAHVAMGAMILAMAVVCAVISFRFLRSEQPVAAPSASLVGCPS